MTTTTQVTWSEESLTWTGTIEPVTSTCTIITPEGTYRQYFTGPGGIWTFSSTDGLSWSAPILALSQTGATNPAVIQVTDGSFVMIYGIQTVNPITERLYRATSPDGLTFSAYIGPYANGAIFSGEANGDFVSVPDLIYINGTTLRMYYVGSTTTSRIYTATSTDNGQSWTREGEITLSGSYGGQTNDPDIIQLGSGNYKLFLTTPPAGTQIGSLRIRSAQSPDGRTFTIEAGDIAAPSGSTSSLLDPDVVAVFQSAKYRLYYGTEPAGTLHELISSQ